MKQIIGWLAAKLSRSSTENPVDIPANPERSRPGKDDLGLPKDMQDLVDDTDMSTGFDPYDTAKLHKK